MRRVPRAEEPAPDTNRIFAALADKPSLLKKGLGKV
jgi:hypothetical protein